MMKNNEYIYHLKEKSFSTKKCGVEIVTEFF